MPSPQTGPIALVTGASRGIGAGAARALARAGADVALVARSEDALETVARDVRALGRRALVLAADVTDPAACARVVREARGAFGRLDALVNNAGVLEPVKRVADAPVNDVERAMAVNFTAVLALTQAALPALRESRGRVVNVSSGAATKPVVGWGAYCASKAAAAMLTRVVAAEEPDVTAVNFSPGTVDTAMQALIRTEKDAMDPAQAQRFLDLHETGGLQSPEDVGRALAWVALRAPRDLDGETVHTRDDVVQAGVRALAE